MRQARTLAAHGMAKNTMEESEARAARGAEAGASVALNPLREAAPPPLPAGQVVAGYRVELVLAQGWFGVTYAALDVERGTPAVLLEYLPDDIAFRTAEHDVSPVSSRHRERFRRGRESFLVEARLLAGLNHPSLSPVARFFEAHRTAYLAFEQREGPLLRQWWPLHLALGERALLERLLPLLDGLAVMHARGLLHRDIRPDTVQVQRDDGAFLLLAWGTFGQAVSAEPRADISPGYAAPEQHRRGGQGPWTDLYALGATLYWMVAGRKPPDAELRAADPQAWRRATEVGRGRFGDAFLAAIDRALALEPAERPRDVLEFRDLLLADHAGLRGQGDALQPGDTVLEGPPPVRSRTPRLRALLSPGGWPLPVKGAVAAALLVAVPAGLVSAGLAHRATVTAQAAEGQRLGALARAAAGQLALFAADQRRFVRTLATDPELTLLLISPDDLARGALRDRFARLLQTNPDLERLALADARGTAVVDTAEPGAAWPAPALKTALEGREPAWPAAGPPDLVVPVAGDDGVVLGAVLMRLRPRALLDLLDAAARTAGAEVSLADATTLPAAPSASAAVPGPGWTVGLRAAPSPGAAGLGAMAAAIAAVALAAAALAYLALRAALRPVAALTEAAEALQAGDFHHAQVPARRRDEIGRMARAFNLAVDVLRQRDRERGG